MLKRVGLWIRSVVLRRRLEREMQEEMGEHLERAAARLMSRGLSPEEARREAIREFGNVAYLQEEGRYARGTAWLDALTGDLRFALRHFGRKPGTTITMFVVLAVGMSISTLLFSYVHSYSVRPPLGVPLEADLVRIRGSHDVGAYGRGVRALSEDEFKEYRRMTGHFRAVAGWADATVAVDAGGDAERRGLEGRASFVSQNYFPVLGVRPVLGGGLPALESDDPALSAVAVIGHEAWEQMFGGRADVIGSTIGVNGVPVTIVGVAPERFVGVGMYSSFRLWMPLSARPLVMREPPGDFRAAARLQPGVGRREATAAVAVVASTMTDAGREAQVVDPSAEVVPLLAANGDPNFDQDVRLMAFSVGLLGLLVLLVTCTNVSALLTGLAVARRQEIAVRLSLGAARTRIVRQLLTESALLATAAAAAALVIVWVVLQAVGKLVPVLPLEMGITWQATIFTFGVALAVGVLFGLSPALHGTRLAISAVLRDSTVTIAAARARLQRMLVVAQIAFTQPLMVLLATSLILVLGKYQPESETALGDRLVTLSIRPGEPLSGDTPAAAESRERLRATMERLADRLQSTAGVDAAVIDWRGRPPLGAYHVHTKDVITGGPEPAVRLSGARAAPGYFNLLDVPLLRGREFVPSDSVPSDAGAAEVPIIVGDDLARRLWSGADPVGRRLRAASDTASTPATLVVVGVIDDPQAATRKPNDPYRIYMPPAGGQASQAMLLRTSGMAQPLLGPIRQAAQEVAPGTIIDVRTLGDVEREERRNFRLLTSGVSAAGLLALLLSAIGLYAVVAFSVSQRTSEIAVRIAVGARGRQIVQKFVADGLRLSALGLLLGLPISLLGLRALMTDPGVPSVAMGPVTAIAAAGVVLVATAAAWIPARRAAAVDPAVTLRS